jgi:hypothetical protein
MSSMKSMFSIEISSPNTLFVENSASSPVLTVSQSVSQSLSARVSLLSFQQKSMFGKLISMENILFIELIR